MWVVSKYRRGVFKCLRMYLTFTPKGPRVRLGILDDLNKIERERATQGVYYEYRITEVLKRHPTNAK